MCSGKGVSVVFADGREIKIFSMVFLDLRKNMVGKRYFQHYTVPVITEKNNEKSGLVIIKNGISIFGHLLKSFLLFLTLWFLEHFVDF